MAEDDSADEQTSDVDDESVGANDETVGADADDEAVDTEDDIPLSALRERIEAERVGEADGSPLSEVTRESADGDEAADLFEQVDVGDIDGEVVWDAVVEGDADPEDLLGEEPRSAGEPEPAAEPTETPDEHVVNKREYCQRCEFFDTPPNATCTNEGAEIVELVDGDHFRVRGCPKVAADDEALRGFVEDPQSGE